MIIVLKNKVECFEILFDSRARVVKRSDEIFFLFMVNFEKDSSPLLSKILYSLHSLRLQNLDDLFCELALTFGEFFSDSDQLAH